jgi:hypothetical protein
MEEFPSRMFVDQTATGELLANDIGGKENTSDVLISSACNKPAPATYIFSLISSVLRWHSVVSISEVSHGE